MTLMRRSPPSSSMPSRPICTEPLARVESTKAYVPGRASSKFESGESLIAAIGRSGSLPRSASSRGLLRHGTAPVPAATPSTSADRRLRRLASGPTLPCSGGRTVLPALSIWSSTITQSGSLRRRSSVSKSLTGTLRKTLALRSCRQRRLLFPLDPSFFAYRLRSEG